MVRNSIGQSLLAALLADRGHAIEQRRMTKVICSRQAVTASKREIIVAALPPLDPQHVHRGNSFTRHLTLFISLSSSFMVHTHQPGKQLHTHLARFIYLRTFFLLLLAEINKPRWLE